MSDFSSSARGGVGRSGAGNAPSGYLLLNPLFFKIKHAIEK